MTMHLPRVFATRMALGLLCQAGGGKGIELGADFVLPAEASCVPAASTAIVQLVVDNRRSTAIELDSLRPVILKKVPLRETGSVDSQTKR